MKVYCKQKSNKNNGKANVLDIEDNNTIHHPILIIFFKSTTILAKNGVVLDTTRNVQPI